MNDEREWDEYEEPKAIEADDEDMHPATPFSPREQRYIMGDLYRSLRTAKDQGDVAREYYTEEAIRQTI